MRTKRDMKPMSEVQLQSCVYFKKLLQRNPAKLKRFIHYFCHQLCHI